jgi:hypothetical protein
MVARGAAYGDYDNDGDLDLLVTANNGPARLLRNEAGRSHQLRLILEGSSSNRAAIGARARVVRDGGATSSWRMVKTGSSYLSQSELPLTFGLGAATKVTSIEVVWPNGRTQRLAGISAGSAVTIVEGKGITRTTPLRPAPRSAEGAKAGPAPRSADLSAVARSAKREARSAKVEGAKAE